MENMEQIIDNFIGSTSEFETNTHNYGTERQYIEWLIRNELGDDPSEEELQELFEQKYCQGYKLDEFCKQFVTKFTRVKVDGSNDLVEVIAANNGDVDNYEGSRYILLEQAMPGDEYDAAGNQIACFTSPAIRLGDPISKLGTAPLYTVVWDIVEGYQPNDVLDMSEACDWEEPREVYLSGQYDVQEGRYC